jgi:hypothetical protein
MNHRDTLKLLNVRVRRYQGICRIDGGTNRKKQNEKNYVSGKTGSWKEKVGKGGAGEK